MADDNAIAKNPATGSALVGVGQALGYEPGVQGWYNLWISPDPTRASATGVPTRLAFGLEEVWQNELPVAMDGPASFKVIGRYFSDKACLMLTVGLPECPTNRPPTTSKTTHPDQQEGLWIPDSLGGVTLAVGNDGGSTRTTLPRPRFYNVSVSRQPDGSTLCRRRCDGELRPTYAGLRTTAHKSLTRAASPSTAVTEPSPRSIRPTRTPPTRPTSSTRSP